MVATRSRGKPAGDAATNTAANTTKTAKTTKTTSALKAPPKRAVKRKANEEEPAHELAAPAQKPAKKTKTAAPAASTAPEKPTTRTTRRAAKTVEQPQAEVVEPAKPVKRATRGRKAAEPTKPIEPVIEPVVEPEENTEKPAVEEAITQPRARTTRAHKAPAKAAKSRAAASVPDAPAPPKRATRGTKATISIAPPTVDAPVSESPLKKPARRPIKKAVSRKTATKSAVESTPAAVTAQEPFEEFPVYPNTPAHITAPISGREALKELPAGYPETPAYIKAPISARDALQELPADYPKTPAHIAAPISSRAALKELPAGYPKTPAHIKAPISSEAALKELPAGYPNTPAHIVAPAVLKQNQQHIPTESFPTSFSVPDSSDDEHEEDEDDIAEGSRINAPNTRTATPAKLSSSPKAPVQTTPAQSEETLQAILNQEALGELPAEYPRTPAHVVNAYGNKTAFDQLPEYPKTPAHVAEVYGNQKALNALPDYPKTPAHIVSAHKNQKAFNELATEYPSTPDDFVDAFENQQAFKQLAEYPKTPAHIAAPVSAREALKELPIDYPTTPAHIMTIKQGLDQLPSYPNTPAPKNIAAMPEQIGSAAKTPSDDGSEEFESALELTEVDLMEVDGDDYVVRTTPPSVNFNVNNNIMLAPPLAPPTMASRASPTKSALRSPVKNNAKTPKKQVTWDEEFETEAEDDFGYSGLLRGLRFLVDVTSKGEDQSLFYVTSLEGMGAQVFREWTETTSLTHVIFKDGSQDTIDKVRAANGTVKCVNTGWLMEIEQTKKRVDEGDYLIDLATATVCTPVTRTPRRRDFFTPAKTPTRFLENIESSSAAKSLEDMPSTPTSEDFDRSIASIEDKENNFEDSTFFKKFSLSAPAKRPWRVAKAQAKTPSKESFLREAPIKNPMFSERPVKSSMFSQPPAKRPMFGQGTAQDSLFSQPPIKGPLFAGTPKRSAPLFGPAPSKPSSLEDAESISKPTKPAEPDTWFDQQAKKSTLLGQAPVKSSTLLSQKPMTSGRFSALLKGAPSTPTATRVAPPVNFLSTHKKRTAAQTFGGSMTTPAKKFRSFF